MKLIINGEEKIFSSPKKEIPLLDLLISLDYEPRLIVVEKNELVINKLQWEDTTVQEGDKLEIVTIIGGGA